MSPHYSIGRITLLAWCLVFAGCKGMSPHYSIGRITLLAWCLVFAGCKGLPFTADDQSQGALAPDFGLNSVPRQWEPDLEAGDTSPRENPQPAAKFDAMDDEPSALKKSPPENKNLLQRFFPGGEGKGEKGERKTLPKGEPSKKIDVDDDFGP